MYTTKGNNSLVTNSFKGWAVNGDTEDANLLLPGAVLNKQQMADYADPETHLISLTGQWQNEGNEGSVSFYINLELQVADYTGSTGETPNENYTGALYGTGLTIDPKPESYGNYNVIKGDKAATAATDAQIRRLTDGVTKLYMSENRKFTLDSFPDDEAILAVVRRMQAKYIDDFQNNQSYFDPSRPTDVTEYRKATTIVSGKEVPRYQIICESVNGQKHYIPVEEITSANYTVRWYVFKYDGTNGWHVDGVLVKRSGQLAVTKTFYGFDASVEEVKKNYTISVKDSSDTTRYTLNLNPKSSDNPTGYVAHDAGTDTYSWSITLTQGAEYTLIENGYTAAAEVEVGETKVPVASLAEYMVTNADAAESVPRSTYHDSEGVHVVARAYATDLSYTNFKTVKFYNSYIPTNTMLLSKVDDNGNPLANVSFQIKKDGVVNEIWRDKDGYYYIFDPTNSGIRASKTEHNYVTTDSRGFAMVIGLKDEKYAGSYSLVEAAAPSGYTAIETEIPFILGEDGTITLPYHPNATLINDMNIQVKNYSETMNVTVNKIWTDHTDQEVTVALCLDGTPMDAYTEVLNADNATPWSFTWENVPAYVGGKLADYTVREMWIGDSAYSGTIDDGYENYIVTYSNPSYTYDENGKPKTLTLNVYNRTYTGGVEFSKVDENGHPLPGATFAVYALYTDEQCQNQYGSSQESGSDGKVNFGALAAGTYYLKETAAPDGYITDDTVYKVVVSGGGTTITRVNDVTEAPVTSIVNVPSSADVIVRKVDGNGAALNGATFQIKKDGSAYIYTGGTSTFSAYPSTTLEDLPIGTYTITETVAPAGYYGMTGTISFTITGGMVDPDPLPDGVTFTGDGTAASPYTFTVTNTPGVELPSTGGPGNLAYTIGGLLLMAASLLYGLGQRRRRERGDVS